MSNVKPPRKLILATIAVFLIAAAAVFWHSETQLPDAISINTRGQPTIGYPKARVHLVVFEDPKCVNCKLFNQHIFRKLKEDYIDSNKIKYTFIPVSFLPNSMPAAISMLCVYNADPLYPNNDLFFTYTDHMYANQPSESKNWATIDYLVQLGQEASPAINLQKLKKCTETEAYRVKIEKNTEYGREIMGGSIATPTLYVNGIEVKELSYDAICKLIKEVFEHQGIYE